MNTWQSFGLGFLGLTMLDVVSESSVAQSNLGGLLSGPGKAAQWFLSPFQPAFGAASSNGSGSSSSGSSSSSSKPKSSGNPPGGQSATFAPSSTGAGGDLVPGYTGNAAQPQRIA